MSASAWLTTIINALDFAIWQAKALGLQPPGIDEIEKIKRAVDEKLAEVLPLAIVGVAASAAVVAAKTEAAINELGDSPTCPRCGTVALQVIAHSPHTGKSTRSLSCSCGWSEP